MQTERQTNKKTDRQIERSEERRIFTLFQVSSHPAFICAPDFLWLLETRLWGMHTRTPHTYSNCWLVGKVNIVWNIAEPREKIFTVSLLHGEEQLVSYHLSRVLRKQTNDLTINENWPCLPVSHFQLELTFKLMMRKHADSPVEVLWTTILKTFKDRIRLLAKLYFHWMNIFIFMSPAIFSRM